MEKTKNSGLVRAVAFLFIAASLIAVAGLAASGISYDESNQSDSSVKSTPQEQQAQEAEPVNLPVEPVPETHSRLLTGTTYQGEKLEEDPLAFLLEGDSRLYGISDADILIEFPSDERTRILSVFSEPQKVEKIGSIAPFRSYFSPFASIFNDRLFCYGCDDLVQYPHDIDADLTDLKKEPGASYLENDGTICSSGSCFRNEKKVDFHPENLPFLFSDQTDDTARPAARVALLRYSDVCVRAFSYSDEEEIYEMSCESGEVKDGFSGVRPSFSNVIVLYSDTVTYNTKTAEETVIGCTSGKGVYLSHGSMQNITWRLNEGGLPVFLNESGEKLAVSCGKTYIALFPSTVKHFSFVG